MPISNKIINNLAKEKKVSREDILREPCRFILGVPVEIAKEIIRHSNCKNVVIKSSPKKTSPKNKKIKKTK